MGIQTRKSTKNKTLVFSSQSSAFSASGSRVRSHQTLNAKGLNEKVAQQNATLRKKRQGWLHYSLNLVLDSLAYHTFFLYSAA